MLFDAPSLIYFKNILNKIFIDKPFQYCLYLFHF